MHAAMTNPRRARFLTWYQANFGKDPDRNRFIEKTKDANGKPLTKARVAQLFNEDEPFGERAAAGLAERLNLPADTFETDEALNKVLPRGAVDVPMTARASDGLTRRPMEPERSSDRSVHEVVRLWGALLASVPEDRRREVVELAQTYAVAPDSERIAQRLIALLETANLRLPSWRQAAVTVAAKMSDEGKVVSGKVLIPTIDEFYVDQLREQIPRSAQSPVKNS